MLCNGLSQAPDDPQTPLELEET
eukprot:SAG31_NODE_30948_length_374_cov_0.894545_1_plen_22_part_01